MVHLLEKDKAQKCIVSSQPLHVEAWRVAVESKHAWNFAIQTVTPVSQLIPFFKLPWEFQTCLDKVDSRRFKQQRVDRRLRMRKYSSRIFANSSSSDRMFVKFTSHKVFVYCVTLMQISRNISSEFVRRSTGLALEIAVGVFEDSERGHIWLEDSNEFKATRSVRSGA